MTSASTFKDKTLMITGGTGSFGNTVLKHFMDTDLAEIRIFSRDEKKQDDMHHRLQEKSPELASKVRFFIGDVRNAQSVRDAMHGVDYIFHAAALKQVPSCEFFPMEAVRTNVIGTDNVLHAAIKEGVDRVVCLSTNKAAYPINAMGKSKAMMESIIYANARNGAGRTTICCTRYGNVMCSRGSVIPLFIDRIRKGEPLTVTDPNMTRFLMNLDEAVDLVQFAFEHANPGDLFIQKAPSNLPLVFDDDRCLFNTGLYTRRYETIYGLFEPNTKPDARQRWFLKGFFKESDPMLVSFEYLPCRVRFTEDPSELVFDYRLPIRSNIDHILGDEENLTRIPASLMGEGNSLLLRRAFEGAVVEAARRAAANYTLAVPQFYGGRIQLLLPLCLTGDKPELALTIQREDGFYAARTCLTLDMAYNNARLICRPETSWIKR